MPSSISSRRSCSSLASRPSSAPSRRSSGSRSATALISDAELRALSGRVGAEASSRFGSVQKALQSMRTDNRGGVSRSQVRNLLGDYGVPLRSADQLFDKLDTSGESAVDIAELRGVLSENASRGNDQKPASRGPSDGSRVPSDTSRRPSDTSRGETKPASRGPSDSSRIPSDTSRLPSDTSRGETKPASRRPSDASRGASDTSRRPSDTSRGEAKDVRTTRFAPPTRRQESERSGSSVLSSETPLIPGRATPATSKHACSAECRKTLTKADCDKIIETIGVAAGRKFVTIRDAFRYLDRDQDGTVDKQEVRYLFDRYGYSSDAADQFYDMADEDGSGGIDYQEFAAYFIPYIQPRLAMPGVHDPDKDSKRFSRPIETCGEPTTQVVGSLTSKLPLEPDMLYGKTKVSEKELQKIIEEISLAVGRRHVTCRGAFKNIDKDRSWNIEKGELQVMFANYGYGAAVADQFFDVIDTDGGGTISFQEFQQHFAPHIECADAKAPVVESGEAKPLIGSSTTFKGSVEMEGRQLSDKEIMHAVKTIGEAAYNKFPTVRDAWNSIDRSKNGSISKYELRDFFNGYHFDKSAADSLLAKVDTDNSGQISFDEFRKYFKPHIEPAALSSDQYSEMRLPSKLGGEQTSLIKGSTTARLSDSLTDDKLRSEEELARVCDTISQAAALRHATVRGAFKKCDKDRGGTVSQYEVRDFFLDYGYGPVVADQFFKKIDTDGSGQLDLKEFAGHFCEYIQPTNYVKKKRWEKCPDWEVHRKGRDGDPEAATREVRQRERLRRSASEPAKPERKKRKPEKGAAGQHPGLSGKLALKERDDPDRRRDTITHGDSHLAAADFADLAEQVALAAASKNASIHKTLRHLDKDYTGDVCRAEVEELFHMYNFNQKQADQFFDFLDERSTGKIRYDALVEHLRPHELRHDDPAEKKRPNVVVNMARRYEEIKQPEICAALGSIGRKAETKHGSLRKALRRVTDNADPSVTRDDTRKFFKKYGYSEAADKFFDHMDRDGRGKVDFSSFQEHFDKHIEDKLNIDCFKRGSSKTSVSGDSGYETTYMSSYTPSSCGSSVR